jgi:hypothetical protein
MPWTSESGCHTPSLHRCRRERSNFISGVTLSLLICTKHDKNNLNVLPTPDGSTSRHWVRWRHGFKLDGAHFSTVYRWQTAENKILTTTVCSDILSRREEKAVQSTAHVKWGRMKFWTNWFLAKLVCSEFTLTAGLIKIKFCHNVTRSNELFQQIHQKQNNKIALFVIKFNERMNSEY